MYIYICIYIYGYTFIMGAYPNNGSMPELHPAPGIHGPSQCTVEGVTQICVVLLEFEPLGGQPVHRECQQRSQLEQLCLYAMDMGTRCSWGVLPLDMGTHVRGEYSKWTWGPRVHGQSSPWTCIHPS